MAEGDLLRMYDATHDVTYTVLYVTVDAVDAATDVVSGSARGKTIVTVGLDLPHPDDAPPPILLQVDASGTWSADFSGVFDILPTTEVSVVASSPIVGGGLPWFGYTAIGGTP